MGAGHSGLFIHKAAVDNMKSSTWSWTALAPDRDAAPRSGSWAGPSAVAAAVVCKTQFTGLRSLFRLNIPVPVPVTGAENCRKRYLGRY